jgi:hypothetical protein
MSAREMTFLGDFTIVSGCFAVRPVICSPEQSSYLISYALADAVDHVLIAGRHFGA